MKLAIKHHFDHENVVASSSTCEDSIFVRSSPVAADSWRVGGWVEKGVGCRVVLPPSAPPPLSSYPPLNPPPPLSPLMCIIDCAGARRANRPEKPREWSGPEFSMTTRWRSPNFRMDPPIPLHPIALQSCCTSGQLSREALD